MLWIYRNGFHFIPVKVTFAYAYFIKHTNCPFWVSIKPAKNVTFFQTFFVAGIICFSLSFFFLLDLDSGNILIQVACFI